MIFCVKSLKSSSSFPEIQSSFLSSSGFKIASSLQQFSHVPHDNSATFNATSSLSYVSTTEQLRCSGWLNEENFICGVGGEEGDQTLLLQDPKRLFNCVHSDSSSSQRRFSKRLF